MLVLSRKKHMGLTITVPPNSEPTVIEVSVIDVRGNTVRMGINAPLAAHVVRSELLEQEQEHGEPVG